MKKKKKEKKFRKSYRRKIKKPFYKKSFFINISVIIIVLLSLIYFLVFSDFLAVKQIEISGNRRIESKDLIDFLDNKTSKPLLFFESKSIIFFIPEIVAREIIEKFPALASFRLSRQYPDTIKLRVKERKPIGTWCQDEFFFFDGTGRIFEKTKVKKGLIVRTENREFSIGEKIFSTREIESIITIWNYLNPEIKVKEFHIDEPRINVLTEEGWLIFFDLKEDIDFQLTKLYLALNEKISEENRKNLEYIDLKFNKKIYFKYRNRESINVIDEN